MLEAFAAGDVGEGEEEVVDVVVARGVGGAGLADEVGELGEELRGGGWSLRARRRRRRCSASGVTSGARGNSWKYSPAMTGESSSCSTVVGGELGGAAGLGVGVVARRSG